MCVGDDVIALRVLVCSGRAAAIVVLFLCQIVSECNDIFDATQATRRLVGGSFSSEEFYISEKLVRGHGSGRPCGVKWSREPPNRYASGGVGANKSAGLGFKGGGR